MRLTGRCWSGSRARDLLRTEPRKATLLAIGALASLAAAVAVLVSAPIAAAGFGLSQLRVGGAAGPEDYIYTTGDVIYPIAGVDDGSYYTFAVTDPTGTLRNPGFACTSATNFASTDNTYTVRASDPTSTSAAWQFTLKQFKDSTCSLAPTKTVSKAFYVARALAYSDSGLTVAQSTFTQAATAYVSVTGLKPAQSDWSTTWILPSLAVACANTGGGDRPDSSANGTLAGGAFLQYRPNTTATGAVWNQEQNYETRPCASFAIGNAGGWALRLQKDAKDFVVLPVFTVDATGSVLYVDNTNPSCLDTGAGTQTQPFCTISAAASQVSAGQTVEVGGTSYPETVTISRSGTASAPIVFTAAPGASPTVTAGADGFVVSGQSYVTIEGFNVTHTIGDGIYIKNSTNVLVSGNHVSYNGQPVLNETARGIRFDGVANSIAEKNIVDHNTAYGIYIDSGSTGNLIRANTSFSNAFGYQRAASGIRVHTSSGNTITGNYSHDNEDSGMDLDKSTDNVVTNNVFANNGDHGIDVTASSFRTTVTGNTVYKSVTAGINVEGTSTATITNNISVDNGIASPRTHGDIRVDIGSTTGTTLDYDQVYLTSPDTLLIWGGSSYTSLVGFQTASGQETHGIQASPRWSNPTGSDFHLTAGSPAIDSANSSAPGQTATDIDGYPRVDDPVTVDSGIGVRSYDDRGAYEYHAPVLDHILVTPATATVIAGGSQLFTAEGYDSANNDLGSVTGSTTFTIGPDGSCNANACTATKAGAHTVTAKIGAVSATASLTVTPGPLDHLVLSPASATITSGGSQAFTADGRDQYDNSLGDVTSSTTFSIAPDGSCAGATCTASVAGAHTVTGAKSGKTGTASLQVSGGTLDHIVISPSSAAITAGGSQTYAAEGFDASGNDVGNVTAFTSFSISPNGTCTGASCIATVAGSHTVTGNDGGKTSTASLTVNAGLLDHLVLSPASATIGSGGSQAYTAEGRDQYDNSLGDVTSSTAFSIAPDGSCTGATCTASVAGAHTVTGTKGGKAGTASLQVTASSVLDHIVISPASATIGAGGSQTYTAQGFDASDNSLGDVTAATTFSVGPDGSCGGDVCTATVAGAHTVTGNDGGKTNTASLAVNAGALDHLALSPASATISSGGSQSYTAQGRDRYDNSLGDVTAATTFSISPDGSCTRAACTASVAGAHTVTGTDAGQSGTASLQVTGGSVLDHIVISPATAAISAGASQTYTAQGFDASNNSLGDVTVATTFSIGPNGSCTGNVCTATVAGSHTVTGNDGGKTSTATLTVNAGAFDHLALSPASATISSGGSQTYTAQARDQYDNSLGDVTAATSFAIAPNGSCTGATCTASVAGAHTVTGTDAGKTGTASLQVGAGALDHIAISPATATISAGQSQTYTAQGFDAQNNSLGDVTAFTTFSISPEGTCTGSACTANAGGAHTVSGNDGGKTATASLTVSYVKNFGFETDLSGWNTSGSGSNITLTRVSGGHSGSWSALLTNTGTTTSTFATLQDSPNWVTTTIAGTYTGSMWVRADTAGAVLKLKFQEYSGSTLAGSASVPITLSTAWQQVTVTYTIKSPGSTLDFQAYVSNPAPGTAFYADDASIVVG
jgi:parallel beta-helix repeat protein